jgi:hypothetical protein
VLLHFKGDTHLIADLSLFPFKLRGTLDDSEARELSREDFIKLFPAFLKTDPGLAPTPTTMKTFVKRNTKLAQSFCNASGNQIRVGTWVFELRPEGWRFNERKDQRRMARLVPKHAPVLG